MKKNKRLLVWGLPAILLIGIALFFILDVDVSAGDSYIVKTGQLNAVVETVGEIQGEKAIEINIPEQIRDRQLNIWGIKIMDMVPEGKIVKKGDYIAQLDQTDISNRMRDRMQEKEKEDADLKNTMIDSTVTLTQKREEVANSLLDLEYNKIDLEQSQYESGAYQRKAQMAYQKAEIALEKKRRDYQLERNRLKMRVQRHESKVAELDELIARYQQALRSTRITTPEDGIVMPGKNWNGKKYSKDDEISTWRPLIATLPDMSTVISETYVKEIDISKITKGDSVRITIDALSHKKYSGKVVHIASIGEDHTGYDMKVFKVIVRFDQSDSELKPGMTCNNEIIINQYENALLIPLTSIFNDKKASFVYLKKGGDIFRQAVELGAEDDKNVVVLKGLDAGDRVLLYEPDSVALGS
jgi:RND family efflux transporter MFP subunit